MPRIYLDFLVVEYSLKQQSFNVITLKEMLNKNARMILEHKMSNDYVVIGIARDHEEADSVVSYFREQIEASNNSER